jgi:glycosyltransferase involved in cell wall biosynthesis
MKIIVTGTRGFPDVQGGVENHCQNLYSCLNDLGCEVIVFARKGYVGNKPYYHNGVKVIPLFSIRNKYFESLIHTFWAIIYARHLISDILHIHGIGPGVLIPFAKLLGFRVVLTTHGENYKHSSWGPLAKFCLRWCEYISVTFADTVIAVSQHSADNLFIKYKKTCTVIPNGVNFKYPETSPNNLIKYNLIPGRYFVFVGRLVSVKGVHDLITAYTSLKCKDWKLVIIGDADNKNKYSDKIKEEARKAQGIVFMGRMTGNLLLEVFSNAGLFVLPSYYECAPISLLEAMSFGLNCLISDLEATREIPFMEKNYFKPGDVNSLSEKLMQFSRSTISNQEKSELRDFVMKKHNWHSIAIQTLEVYKATVMD